MKKFSLRPIAMLGLAALLGACQVTNSNSADEFQYGPVQLDSSDPNFAAAYRVLQNKCISCHTHSNWAAYTSSASWADESRVVIRGDAENSPLIQQIRANLMPQDGSISSDETQTLVNWIDNMP